MLVLFEFDQVLTSRPKPANAIARTVPRIAPSHRACPSTSLPCDTTIKVGIEMR